MRLHAILAARKPLRLLGKSPWIPGDLDLHRGIIPKRLVVCASPDKIGTLPS